jgi:uncharacterized protein
VKTGNFSMKQDHIAKISNELKISIHQVQATATMLGEGSTIPFIARYRKEATGGIDETAITSIRDRLKQLEELDTRKAAVLKSLKKHGHLTDELIIKVETAETLSILEDIYLPYRPKRRTRATAAREKGLEPLAFMIFDQKGIDPKQAVQDFINPEKGVETEDAALSGARDIIAEIINEDESARAELRELFFNKGAIMSSVASGKETEGAKYKDYYDWQEPAASAPSHRILAMRRGEHEDILNLTLAPPEDSAIQILEALFVKGFEEDTEQVRIATHDAYKRLLCRSMETELRVITKERADTEAIKIFADNLRELLLAPPLGPKRVMGIDPGFRTGCKIACLDRQGKLLHHDTVYLHLTEKNDMEAAIKIQALLTKFTIEAIAVGNGTAGRETLAFIRHLNLSNIPVLMVDESGASVYSASEIAREEFPDLDLTVRGAISIGRRLMDPLSELVKIDPKAIGVGQYQHDVNQTALKQALDDVVISCVNAVGVDVNRASAHLLTYVSGLGPQLAKNIVAFRDENGPFISRNQLKKVQRLGPKAFEQAGGFLRIPGGKNPLDASAVHPESYDIVDAMAKDLDCTIENLMKQDGLRRQIELKKYVTEKVGLPTLTDIINELAKPGRDPRKQFEIQDFAEGISSLEDLQVGMKLPGIVTNVTAFGAFVDIGVHQDGLVHISQLADRFVKDPSKVVKVHQHVTVTVLDVDLNRKRIALTMKTSTGTKKKKPVKSKSPKKGPNRKKMDKNKPFHNPFAELLDK